MSAIDPVVLFFLLGVLAGVMRSDLRLPGAVYEFVSIVLLLAIGLKGGVELAREPVEGLALAVAAILVMGLTLPLVAYPVLRWVGRLPRPDAASIAAHYGSVSVGTFAVAVAYCQGRGIDYEKVAPLWVVLLEVPAILVGIVLAKGLSAQTRWGSLAHELFLGKSVVLLLGGVAIGWAAGPDGIKPLAPLFIDLFKGILAIFLLEMGLIAAQHLGDVLRHGAFLVGWGLLAPLAFANVGAALAYALGLSTGGVLLLATLAGSASYIAAPATMRAAVPEANPALSLTASLAITFPFNILVGIPLYHRLALWWTGGP
jgi:hypothetical protein